MDDIWVRFVEDLAGRVGGPMSLRLLVQPAMASLFGVLSGLRDARGGKPAYFWGLVSDPATRAERIKDGWKSLGKVFVLALLLDVVYQVVVLGFVYPGEAVFVAFVLAIVPYLILRGPVNRLVGLAEGAGRRSI